MIPSEIEERHIRAALEQIDVEGVPANRRSRKYQLRVDGKDYPPKRVVALASMFATGTMLSSEDFGGGAETNGFLMRFGLQIIGPDGKPLSGTSVRSPSAPRKKKGSVERGHPESCSECKNAIADLLRALYGSFGVVKAEHKLALPARLDLLRDSVDYKALRTIYQALVGHRGHENFVRRPRMASSDYWIEEPNFVVELDESQHFSAARAVALRAYPDSLALGYDRGAWIELCERLNRRDGDPPYRDEQRAWYDTVRDFVPSLRSGSGPTVRIRMGGYPWCSLDGRDGRDVAEFRRLVPGLPAPKRSSKVRFRLARVVMDIGVSEGQAKELGASYDRPAWNGSFEAIRNAHNADPQAYRDRIFRMADEARRRGADGLMLPACTLFYGSDEELGTYLKRFESLPWVISGLWGSGAGPFERFGEGEQAAVIRQGKVLHRFDGHFPWNVKMGPWNLYAAISSTIGAVRIPETKTSHEHPPERQKPVLVLDMGHNQYKGRYKKTLTSVQRYLKKTDSQPVTVVLAFWHYRNSASNYRWIVDEEQMIGFERIKLNHHGVQDWLDIIDLS